MKRSEGVDLVEVDSSYVWRSICRRAENERVIVYSGHEEEYEMNSEKSINAMKLRCYDVMIRFQDALFQRLDECEK